MLKKRETWIFVIIIVGLCLSPYIMFQYDQIMKEKHCPYGKLKGIKLTYDCQGFDGVIDRTKCKRVTVPIESNHCVTQDPKEWLEEAKKFGNMDDYSR